ncbi:MAG: ester cyclase [Nitrososphaera sp.]
MICRRRSFQRPHNRSAVVKYYAQYLIRDNPQVENRSEGFKQFFSPFFEGFPDSHTTTEHMIAEVNLVMWFLNTLLLHRQVKILRSAAYQQNDCNENC